MLTEDDQISLLKCFPNAELSYETIIHNKVQNADFILAIPEGIKFFAWFTTFKNQNVCILMEISDNKKICSLKISHCCFHDNLSFGTIFYGTVFKYNSNSFFSVENILHYKGADCSTRSFTWKLETLGFIFSREIKQLCYTNYSVVFGLPLFSNSFNDLMKKIPFLPYKIKYLQFRDNKRQQGNHCFNLAYIQDNSYSNQNISNRSNPQIYSPREKTGPIVFQVKPDIQNDIYHLFTYLTEKDEDNYHSVACIPDYKTSVMMNKLFRKIKENANLDALEESDDEEEFENNNEDKFVFLERTYNMVCEYNYKFKKWTPLRLSQKNEKIVTMSELIRLEKNNK
jgi:hypothetical protein